MTHNALDFYNFFSFHSFDITMYSLILTLILQNRFWKRVTDMIRTTEKNKTILEKKTLFSRLCIKLSWIFYFMNPWVKSKTLFLLSLSLSNYRICSRVVISFKLFQLSNAVQVPFTYYCLLRIIIAWSSWDIHQYS